MDRDVCIIMPRSLCIPVVLINIILHTKFQIATIQCVKISNSDTNV